MKSHLLFSSLLIIVMITPTSSVVANLALSIFQRMYSKKPEDFMFGNYSYHPHCRYYKYRHELFCDGGRQYEAKPIDEIWSAEILNLEIVSLIKEDILPKREDSIGKLIFINNSITYLESGVFDAFDLTYLEIADNLLTSMDESILTSSVGSTLRTLKLNHNHLTSLSDDVFKYLEKLETLDLHDNPGLFNETRWSIFGELRRLESLNLENTGIVSLNDNVFTNLKSLTTLNLARNKLTSIPLAINALERLETLDMNNNLITILNFTGDLISNLKNLRLNDMAKLTNIEDCAFCSFPELQTLYLNGSKLLTNIHPNAFGVQSPYKTQKLEYLYLQNCGLTTLPQNLLKWCDAKLKKVQVQKNPFECTCKLNWFLQKIQKDSAFRQKFQPVSSSMIVSNISLIDFCGAKLFTLNSTLC